MKTKSIIVLLLIYFLSNQGNGMLIINSKTCGPSIGTCSDNRCCSKYGYCGTSDDYCNINKGCQINYGLCYEEDEGDKDDTLKTKCGKGIGSCSNNLCCSKEGYCGSSDQYCNIKNGCQMDYGLCFESDDDGNDDYSNTKCGSDYGSCPNNLCCSSNNICGKTDNHCNLSKGCQLQYGLCYEDLGDDDGNNNTKCGPNYGSCPDNLCCSKQGYCGKTDDYCNVLNGCQNEYGLCYEYDDDDDDNDDDGNIKECGEGYGSCSNSKCCSKNGRCGTTDDYCNINKGCQIDYGLCYKPISDIREGSGKPCGRNYGSCDFPECCSKSDKCVLGTNECLESNGCQNDYGLCLSTI